MSWQDIVLTVGGFIFSLALIPTVRAQDKPPLSTSIPTGIVLLFFAYTYFSLDLIVSTFSTLLMATLWLIVAKQKINMDKKSKINK